MFCPNCAKENSVEQKFCRACGLNLEKAAESLLLQLPDDQNAGLAKREMFLERFGNFVFGGFLVVVLIAIVAIIYTIFVKFVLSGTGVIFGLFMIVFMIFAALALAFVGFMEKIKEDKKSVNPNLQKELSEKPDTAKLLEDKPFEPVPSVVENSTELLHIENKTRKFE